jgi:branched-chain amino acid transport system substrate-binding protein
MRRRSRGILWAASLSAVTLMILCLVAGSVSAQAPKTIKVGLILPLSGPGASIGQYIREGMEFIIDRVNNAGGIKSIGGAKIVLEVADSRGQPEVGMSEAERLIVKEKVVALTGCYNSGVTLTATTVAEKYGIPFVVVISTSDEITERGYKYTFRPHGNSSMDQKILVDFLIDMGAKMKAVPQNIAIVFDSSEGAQVPAKFWRKFLAEANQQKRANFKIVYDETYPAGMTDFNPVILKLKSAKPDFMILISASTSDAILLSKNMASQRYAPAMGVLSYGGATLDPVFVPTTGKNTEYWYTIQGWTKDLLETSPPFARDMFDSFKKKYNKEVSGDVCKVFLDAYTLVYGLEKAGTTEPKALRDAIAGLDIQEGPALMVATTRRMKLGPDGQNPYYESGVAQIVNGGYTLVWPDHVAKPGYKPVWPVPQWKDRK